MGITSNGFGFTTSLGNYIIYNGTNGNLSNFNVNDLALSTPVAGGGTLTSLSLTPVVATPVPFEFNPSFGILALGGAWAVRKMIQKSKSGAVSN
jgi:hypothetical protein